MVSTIRSKFSNWFDKSAATLLKALLLTGLAFVLSHALSNHRNFRSLQLLFNLQETTNSATSVTVTNISHLVFGIAGSAKTWLDRGPYIDLWWQPNRTRGMVWLDTLPIEYQWPSSSPLYRVSENTTTFNEYASHGMPFAIRMTRVILETIELGMDDVRWYVMADDDTVLFVDNLVEVLGKYDHDGYYYVGGISECVGQNARHSFGMAFGGGGFAVSYPLAKALGEIVDGCLKRYPNLYGSDHVLQSCIAELGVSLTREPGFHQIDLHGDISGFLSAHPQAPLLSFHHLDYVDPIFPSMTIHESLQHLMKAARFDSSRLLQQIICYDDINNWSVSIAWGYSVYIYEKLHPPAYLQMPLQTFRPWGKRAKPPFMFNVRPLSKDPCEMPHVFYLEEVEFTDSNRIVTSYSRRTEGLLSACGNHSAEFVSEIRVFSPAKRMNWGEGRRECCDIESSSKNLLEISVRACRKNEALKWSLLS